FGTPDSALIRAGQAAGLGVAAEGFADRAYEPDGSLVSRTKPGALIHDADAVVTRAVQLAREHTLAAIDGSIIRLNVDTICVHSDTEEADVLAGRIRAGFEAAGIGVTAVSA